MSFGNRTLEVNINTSRTRKMVRPVVLSLVSVVLDATAETLPQYVQNPKLYPLFSFECFYRNGPSPQENHYIRAVHRGNLLNTEPVHRCVRGYM